MAFGRSAFLIKLGLAAAAGQVCQTMSGSAMTSPRVRSDLATSTSTVSSGGAATTGGGGGGGGLPPLAKYAATPPAATATPSTTRRAAFITLHFPRNGTAKWAVRRRISAVKRQSMVNEAYPNRVNIALIRGLVPVLGRERGHPFGLRVHQERGRRERDAVGYAAVAAMQPLRPLPPRQHLRQRKVAKLED